MQSKTTEDSTWSSERPETLVNDPVMKGIECLNNCISLCIQKPNDYVSCLESARVALAYIWMEVGNPVAVLQLANEVLDIPIPEKEIDDIEVQLSNQRRATMRLYAFEAMCLIGDANSGFKFLSRGDKEEDLLSDMKTIANHLTLKDGSAKNGDSESLIHLNQLSVASAYALMGDTFNAKQISFKLMDNSVDAQIVSSAQTVLRYCTLIEQNETE